MESSSNRDKNMSIDRGKEVGEREKKSEASDWWNAIPEQAEQSTDTWNRSLSTL